MVGVLWALGFVSQLFQEKLQGMVPHKIERGKQALRRLKCYEGIPPPYDKRKRVVVPGALRMLCLKPGRRYCDVGRISDEVGWKYKDVVEALETKRKIRAASSIRLRSKLSKITRAASEKQKKQIAPHTAIINSYGYN